ncbi:hypothetical protein MKW92_044302 [Papaver armeniacum]|nr:hypothetical protein MKW92_044302 [Papaver armeniacum]
MASTAIHFISHRKPLNHTYTTNPTSITTATRSAILSAGNRFACLGHIKCTSNPTPQKISNFPESNSELEIENEEDQLDIEKRRKSEIIRDRKSRLGLVKPEPKNFEVGWKRTKEILVEKPKGYVIADYLEKLEGLMERGDFGSTELLAKTGEIVAEAAREEAEVLREEGVEDRLITELSRVLRLMEMDLAMVKASVKEETLKERIEQAKARCRQAILVANSF